MDFKTNTLLLLFILVNSPVNLRDGHVVHNSKMNLVTKSAPHMLPYGSLTINIQLRKVVPIIVALLQIQL